MKKLYLLSSVVLSSYALADTTPVPLTLNISDKALFNNFVTEFAASNAKYSLEIKNSNFAQKGIKSAIVQKAFEENELSATRKYENKVIRLLPKIKTITSDVLNNAVLTESLPDSLNSIIYRMKDNNDEKLFKLKKGDAVDLVCKLEGFSLGAVSFKQCIFTEDYLKWANKTIIENLNTASIDNWKPTSKMEVFYGTIYLENEKNIMQYCENKSPCFTPDKVKELNGKDKKLDIFSETTAKKVKELFSQKAIAELPPLPEFE